MINRNKMADVGIIDDSALYPLNDVALKRNLSRNLYVSVSSRGSKRFTDVNFMCSIMNCLMLYYDITEFDSPQQMLQASWNFLKLQNGPEETFGNELSQTRCCTSSPR